MSRIDDLIVELCPAGVQFKALVEIGSLFSGLTGKSKADFSEGNARFASYMNVFDHDALDVTADDFVRVAPQERQNRLSYGDILFTASSESAAEVGMSSVVTVEPAEPMYLNSFCFGLRPSDPDLVPAFAKHLFRSREVRDQIVRTANGVTRHNVSKARFLEVRVPVPPIEVQREIVNVLDLFSMPTTETHSSHLLRERESGGQS
jgi:type I restriction enzyme S subunit